MIRDHILFDNKTNYLQTKCFGCSSKDHLSKFCPLLHYTPHRLKTVKNYLKDPGQKSRISFQRNNKKKMNSLFFLNEIQKYNQDFRKFSKYCTDFDNPEIETIINENSPASRESDKKYTKSQNEIKRKSSKILTFKSENRKILLFRR